MRRILLASVAAALLLASAADAKPPPPMELEAGSNDAVVYVFRRQVAPQWTFRDVAVEIDRRRVVKFPYNGCTAVRVPAGRHVVGVSWPPSLMELDIEGKPPVEMVADLEPGGRYYFSFDVELFSTGSQLYDELRWSIAEVGFQSAKVPLSKCFFKKPRNGWENGPAGAPPRDPKASQKTTERVA